jgi:UDP-N-acetylglucosamine acyltransferase
MTPEIHPSAIIAAGAHLADSVSVGPLVVIEDGVTVGSGTRLLAGTVLQAGTRVGRDCTLGPYAVLGGEPMDSSFKGEESFTVLGDRVELREFATVHRATGAGAATLVGDDTLIMSYAHVSHNAQVGKHCVLTTTVQLGGHVQVGDHAVLGAGAMLHQFCRVGPYAMLGAASGFNQDILPFFMARGNMAKHYRLNRVGLQRNGFSSERYHALEQAFRALRRRDRAALAELAQQSADVQLLQDFIAQSKRGVARFAAGRRQE